MMDLQKLHIGAKKAINTQLEVAVHCFNWNLPYIKYQAYLEQGLAINQ